MEYDELNEHQKIQVAKGFDATPEMIPFIPYLLQDLFELGSSPKIIIEILKSLELSPNSKLLDIACGKGAVSIQVAKQLGFHCLGIDLFKPFVEIANEKAIAMNVDNLCTFEVGDAIEAVKTKRGFDVVILASAESVLGQIRETIKLMSECIHENGYIIFDGAYLIGESSLDNPDYSTIKNYEDTIKQLTSYGDKIIREVTIPPEEVIQISRDYTDAIRIRANELSVKYPEKKDLFLSYVEKQMNECSIIENHIVGCTWCLKKF